MNIVLEIAPALSVAMEPASILICLRLRLTLIPVSTGSVNRTLHALFGDYSSTNLDFIASYPTSILMAMCLQFLTWLEQSCRDTYNLLVSRSNRTASTFMDRTTRSFIKKMKPEQKLITSIKRMVEGRCSNLTRSLHMWPHRFFSNDSRAALLCLIGRMRSTWCEKVKWIVTLKQ